MSSRSGLVLDIFERHSRWIVLAAILLSVILHAHIMNRELSGIHLWRQTETQSVILQFAEGDMDIFNPRVNNYAFHEDGIKRMQFPLMEWSFAWFYRMFGDHIFISRFLSLLLSIGSILGAYSMGKALFRDSVAGALAGWALTWSPVFFYYSVNPLPDNLALMASFWFLAFYYRWHREDRWPLLAGAAAMLMLAILSKLPFAVFGAIPFFDGIRMLIKPGIGKIARLFRLWIPFALAVIPPAIWYWKVVPDWKGNGVVSGIFEATGEDVPELLYIFKGLLISVLPELLLNYGAVIFFLFGLFLVFFLKHYRNKLFWGLAGLGAGLTAYVVFELNMITTVHDYYLFPFLPPLFMLVAYAATQFLRRSSKPAKIVSLVLLVSLPLFAFLRIHARWSKDSAGYHPDYAEYQQELIDAVPADAKCLVGSDGTPYALLYIVRKHGAQFHPGGNIADWMWEKCKAIDVEYLYSDSREFEAKPFVKKALGDLVTEKGAVKVWKLNFD